VVCLFYGASLEALYTFLGNSQGFIFLVLDLPFYDLCTFRAAPGYFFTIYGEHSLIRFVHIVFECHCVLVLLCAGPLGVASLRTHGYGFLVQGGEVL